MVENEWLKEPAHDSSSLLKSSAPTENTSIEVSMEIPQQEKRLHTLRNAYPLWIKESQRYCQEDAKP